MRFSTAFRSCSVLMIAPGGSVLTWSGVAPRPVSAFSRELQHFPAGVDAPEPEPAVGVGRIEKDCDGHGHIDPVGGRHQVHEPREISVREFWAALAEKLARFVCQRRLILRLRRRRRVVSSESRERLAEQHQKGHSLRAVHARVRHDERVDLCDELVGRRDRLGDVVKPSGDFTEAQPPVSRHEAFDVGGSDDLEVVCVGQRADQLRVGPHDKRGEVELTVVNHCRLSLEIVIGRLEIETFEIGILKQFSIR